MIFRDVFRDAWVILACQRTAHFRNLPRYFHTSQDESGFDYIRWWFSEHKEAKLVIVDTLQKFRKLSKGKLNVYAEDYEALSELKKVADAFNVAFVVIHHLQAEFQLTA